MITVMSNQPFGLNIGGISVAPVESVGKITLVSSSTSEKNKKYIATKTKAKKQNKNK